MEDNTKSFFPNPYMFLVIFLLLLCFYIIIFVPTKREALIEASKVQNEITVSGNVYFLSTKYIIVRSEDKKREFICDNDDRFLKDDKINMIIDTLGTTEITDDILVSIEEAEN